MPIRHSLYDEGGTPTVDQVTCTHCGECARICAGEILHMDDGRVVVNSDSKFGCIACGHCMMVCPNGSIRVTGRGISPADIVPLAPADERAGAKALAALMQARRSIRHFKKDEIAPELLDQVVSMASSGPMGIPPWDVGCVVVRGHERVQQLAGEVVNAYSGLLGFLKPWVLGAMRPFMKKAIYEQMSGFVVPLAQSYVEGRKEGRDLLFYNAPAVLLFHHSPYTSASEAMIACTYAMLAAESMGLGTTMIGAAAPMIMRNHKLCKSLGIPDGNNPAIALIIGYPAVKFRKGIVRRFSSVTGNG